MKQFEVKTKICFGESALERLSSLSYKKVLVIADPFVVSSGMIKQVTERLERGGIPYTLFSDVVPDPPVEKVIAGVRVALDSGADCIVAIGGGCPQIRLGV